MPKIFTSIDFERARSFIKSQARPLDKRLFEYHFESGPAEAVIAELSKFQNGDGGFGNGLEPDFRMKASSPIATTVAFQYLGEVNAAADEELVRRGIGYFISSYDTEQERWHQPGKEVNDAPHAPWWRYEEGRDTFGWDNPGVEIVGYLHRYSSLVPQDFLSGVTEVALAHIRAAPDDSIDVHSMLSYLRGLDFLPEPSKSIALEKIIKSAQTDVTSSPEWPGQGARLSWYAPTPTSPLADTLKAEIERNLDSEINDQAEDGSWLPNWSWGQYEDAWEDAKRDWKGYLTVQMLKTLRAYGRILPSPSS